MSHLLPGRPGLAYSKDPGRQFDTGVSVVPIRPRLGRGRHRRGAIFIIALAITVILSALLLVFVQQMRTEANSSANRFSAVQADAVEQGAEQWVLAQVEANTTPLSGTGGTASAPVDVTTVAAEALQVGDGYFWILHPDPTQDQTYAFGISDESAKLNLNGATADQLMNLPDMTQDEANAISSWPTSAGNTGGTLTYETVEELLLADTETPPQLPTILYGYDLNHDGVIDDAERIAANGAATTNGTTLDSRGIFNYVTAYSTTAPPAVNGVTPPPAINRATGRPVKTVGLINVNTAPAQVLSCLPGLTTADGASLIAGRAPAAIGDTNWVRTVLGQTKAQAIAGYITGVSYQYSADIVAVSADGRAFRRVRIVVDARQQPAKIVYRKDITSLDWPLPIEVRTSLRAGKGVPQSVSGSSNQQAGGGLIH